MDFRVQAIVSAGLLSGSIRVFFSFIAGLWLSWMHTKPHPMGNARDIQAVVRTFTDVELLRQLGGRSELSPTALALAILEAESRGGIEALRTRVEALPCLPLHAIGFWQDSPDEPLPRPQSLVKAEGFREKIPAITAYLRAGQICASYFGDAQCRFADCTEGIDLGSGELTDGEWVWPEGLPHYVEHHSVMLPEEFISKMMAVGWRPPVFDFETTFSQHYRGVRYDLNRWISWAAAFKSEREVG